VRVLGKGEEEDGSEDPVAIPVCVKGLHEEEAEERSDEGEVGMVWPMEELRENNDDGDAESGPLEKQMPFVCEGAARDGGEEQREFGKMTAEDDVVGGDKASGSVDVSCVERVPVG